MHLIQVVEMSKTMCWCVDQPQTPTLSTYCKYRKPHYNRVSTFVRNIYVLSLSAIHVQAPSLLDTCTTSLISSYEVRIDYTNKDGRSTDTSIVPGTITSVMMSDYFPGHPLPDTNYTITVVAINEGGRGTSNIPTCKLLFMCAVSTHTQNQKLIIIPADSDLLLLSKELLYSYQLPVLYNYQTAYNIILYSQNAMAVATHIQPAIGLWLQVSILYYE